MYVFACRPLFICFEAEEKISKLIYTHNIHFDPDFASDDICLYSLLSVVLLQQCGWMSPCLDQRARNSCVMQGCYWLVGFFFFSALPFLSGSCCSWWSIFKISGLPVMIMLQSLFGDQFGAKWGWCKVRYNDIHSLLPEKIIKSLLSVLP